MGGDPAWAPMSFPCTHPSHCLGQPPKHEPAGPPARRASSVRPSANGSQASDDTYGRRSGECNFCNAICAIWLTRRRNSPRASSLRGNQRKSLRRRAFHQRLHFLQAFDLPYRPPASKRVPGDCTFRPHGQPCSSPPRGARRRPRHQRNRACHPRDHRRWLSLKACTTAHLGPEPDAPGSHRQGRACETCWWWRVPAVQLQPERGWRGSRYRRRGLCSDRSR